MYNMQYVIVSNHNIKEKCVTTLEIRRDVIKAQ